MTPEDQQKLYEDLKNWLIAKHGYNFLKMSEDNQNKMIIGLIESYIAKLKFDFE